MLRNYLLTTYRNMLRKPVFSLINISGLAIGMAAFMMIVLYVADELSYDRFHQKSDRIFRVTIHGVFANNVFNTTYTAAPLAQALISEFPEVEQVSRIMLRNQHSVAIGNQTFIEDQWLYADSTFFDVFSFGLIEGDPEKSLPNPGHSCSQNPPPENGSETKVPSAKPSLRTTGTTMWSPES